MTPSSLYQHPLALPLCPHNYMIPKSSEPGENIAGKEDKKSPLGNGPTLEEEREFFTYVWSSKITKDQSIMNSYLLLCIAIEIVINYTY